jgi:DnaJ-domain-containing protein 1
MILMNSFFSNSDFDPILSIFLFGLSFIIFASFLSKPKNNSSASVNSQEFICQLACLLEDAPMNSLKGQFYELTCPLVCLLEDAPASSLKGQFYELAYPLMTPFACILTKTWHEFYTRNLGKLGINYWEWKSLPESTNLYRELSFLLALPQPQKYTRQVLESLALGRDPFETIPDRKNSNDNFGNYKDINNLADLNVKIQTEIKLEFKDWHDRAYKILGKDLLNDIYKLCYGTNWQIVEKIVFSISTPLPNIELSARWWKVLGVRPLAKSSQVEAAYKSLLRTWHPDLNPHPLATEITSRINLAYEEYQKYQELSRDRQERMPELLNKIQRWFKL